MSFNAEQIKLDPNFTTSSSSNSSATNSTSSKTSSTKNVNSSLIDEIANDDEMLASRLNLQLTADEILNACKGQGLNGIQHTCMLKPGRMRTALLRRLVVKNEADLFNVSDKENNSNNNNDDIDLLDSSDDDHDHDDETKEIDETLPYGGGGDRLGSSDETTNSKTTTTAAASLYPATPSVVLDAKKDAYSPHLQYFCMSNPISVVRGLAAVLRMDLSLFSTKSLVELDPDHVVEVRTQRQMPSDENWDNSGHKKTWK